MEENRGNVDQLLIDAALKGDVTILKDLVDQDPLLLRRPSKIQPLHISSKSGRLEFTEELLRLNPSLAEELDPTDMSSPLHLASGNGHVDVVRALVSANPCMCLTRDAHGMNPAHVAAMKGHVLVLGELLKAVPAVSKECVGGGGRESILHLCIKYNQLEALSKVVKMAPPGDARMLLNAKDRDGNTILHLAMADQQLEVIQLLVSDDRVETNVQNGYGWTARDIFKDNDKNVNNKRIQFSIGIALMQAKHKLLSTNEMIKKEGKEKITDWFRHQRSSLMIVASLVASMAFQAGLTPPYKHDDLKKDEIQEALAEIERDSYMSFVIANTIGLVSSMSSLILLISGLPGRRFFAILVMMMMWMAVSCMAYTYAIILSVNAVQMEVHLINNDNFLDSLLNFRKGYKIGVPIWACGMGLILLWHLTTWTLKLYKMLLGWLTWLRNLLTWVGLKIEHSQSRF